MARYKFYMTMMMMMMISI